MSLRRRSWWYTLRSLWGRLLRQRCWTHPRHTFVDQVQSVSLTVQLWRLQRTHCSVCSWPICALVSLDSGSWPEYRYSEEWKAWSRYWTVDCRRLYCKTRPLCSHSQVWSLTHLNPNTFTICYFLCQMLISYSAFHVQSRTRCSNSHRLCWINWVGATKTKKIKYKFY